MSQIQSVDYWYRSECISWLQGRGIAVNPEDDVCYLRKQIKKMMRG